MNSCSTISGIILLLGLILASCDQNPSNSNQLTSTDSILNVLNLAVEKNGKDPDAYIRRAEYFLQGQKLNDALNDVNKALELDPNNVKGYLTISSIYILMGKPQQALESLNAAISLDAGNVEAYLSKAKLCLVMKDYENCAINVEKVLELDKDNADAFYLKGVTLDENGEKNKAIQAFQQAVMLNPGHYDALMQLGYAFTDSNPQLATDYFRNACKMDSTSMEALYNLGMLYQEHNQPLKALDTYKQMLHLDPKNKLALYNTGYVNLVYIENYKAGVDFFSKAIAVDSVYTDAYFNRGYCFELSGEFQPARNDYQKVLELRINDRKAIDGLNRLDKIIRKK